MAFGILAEALLRIEHKVDAILKAVMLPGQIPPMPLHFVGQQCPICYSPIDYQVDVQKGVVVRRCGCKTGKVPSMIPLTPVEVPRNGNSTLSDSSERSADSVGPTDGVGRKAR